MFAASQEVRVEHLQNNAMELVYLICSIISQPVEILLRWSYGSRYFPLPVTFFSAAMMLLLPALISLFTNFMHMIPLLSFPPTPGMFGLGDFARIYFAATAIHGVRQWRRMIDPSREMHSRFEGPALRLFAFLPRGSKFWWTRLLWEPLLIVVTSIVLQDLFIAQPPLVLYLRFAALALFMKNFVSWFRSYEVTRDILDVAYSGPAIGKLVENQATEEDLIPFHIASFPKNLDPEVRQAAAERIARNYRQE